MCFLTVVSIERLRGSNSEEYNEEDEEIELEIVEVEELDEPVPTQDSCLQVTEEDIAFCMGELENPLPEVDQEEHPLRILSQENMTVVSTFTGTQWLFMIQISIEKINLLLYFMYKRFVFSTPTFVTLRSIHSLYLINVCLIVIGSVSACVCVRRS